MQRRSLTAIDLRVRPGRRSQGLLRAGAWSLPVALGRASVRANKREGDGATPRGRFRPLQVWWRADRTLRPPTLLPVRRIGIDDAWCEDPADRRYNRPFRRAVGEPGDRLWRNDRLYDVIVEIDHNTSPRIGGRGSAVFIHLARAGLAPTAGCIGLPLDRLKALVARLGPRTRLTIH